MRVVSEADASDSGQSAGKTSHEIRNEMDDGGKRKYSDEEILKSCDVSSETIRQISVRETD